MDKDESVIRPKTFLEKVATFDFDKYYTKKLRFACHCFMWLIFTFLIQVNLFFDSRLPLEITFAFACRSLICNMTVFYLFFYFILPKTILKNRIITAVLSIPFCIILWILLNHYCLIFIDQHFEMESPYYKDSIAANVNSSFAEIISPRHILVVLIPVFYSISPFFFIKIVFDILRFYSKWFKSERRSAHLEIEKLNLEKDFLRSQLNPHFLFNTLNNLYGLSLRNDQRTPEVIMQLSEMMRYTLYESDAGMVLLSKELVFLKNYVLLEKMRYKNNKDIVFNLDDSQVDIQMIAPLLTFTFIENAFKYGLKLKNEGFLKIDISIANNVFYFSIINDKEENVEEKEFGGIGTDNIRKRLELLYPDKHKLKMEDRGQSFWVEMKINL